MRAIERLSGATVLLLTLIWILNQLFFARPELQIVRANPPVAYDEAIQQPSPESDLDARQNQQDSAPHRRRRPSIADLAPSRNQGIGSLQVIVDDVSRTKVAANDRVVVVGRRKTEDTSWVVDELPE